MLGFDESGEERACRLSEDLQIFGSPPMLS